MNTRIIHKIVVVVGLLGIVSTSFAIEGTWSRKADMPTSRLLPATGVVEGKIYTIGGGARNQWTLSIDCGSV